MREKKWILASLGGAILFLLALAVPVFASEGGHGNYWKDYLFQFINFIVLLAILIKFIRPALKGYLEKRHNQVKEELQRAKELSEAAEKAYAEAQQRLENLDAEIKKIREKMLAEVEQEKKKLLEEAERKAELMRAQAEQGLKDEINQLKKKLREEISLEALKLAEEIVKKSITRDDQKRLINLFVQQLGSKN